MLLLIFISIIDINKELSEKHNIIIFTAKVRADRPLVNGKTGYEHVEEWLEKHDLAQYINKVTAEKPRGVAYIDDKAMRFLNWDQALSDLDNL